MPFILCTVHPLEASPVQARFCSIKSASALLCAASKRIKCLSLAGCNGGQGASSGDLWAGDGAREPSLALGGRGPLPDRPAEPSELAALPYDVLQAIFAQLPLAVRPHPVSFHLLHGCYRCRVYFMLGQSFMLGAVHMCERKEKATLHDFLTRGWCQCQLQCVNAPLLNRSCCDT